MITPVASKVLKYYLRYKSLSPGAFMRRAFLISALLLSSTTMGRADGISSNDPKIIVGRGSDSVSVTTLQFSVPVNSTGGGFFSFENATGQDWSGLKLTLTFKNAKDAMGALTCESNIYGFNDCASARHGRTVTIDFFDGDIPSNSQFFLDLNDDGTLGANHGKESGSGGWKDTVTVTAIPTPEPSALLLIFGGAICVFLRRGLSLSGRSVQFRRVLHH